MKGWLLPSIMALVVWGLWAFFPKLATRFMGTESVLFYELIAALVTGFFWLWFMGARLEFQPMGMLWATLAGITGASGTFFYLIAAGKGRISIIATLTALYPIVTLVLAHFFLKEPITFKQIVGMILALVAIGLMAY